MKVLVTGGAGFIGSHVADGYLERGDEVVIVDNLRTGRRENINSRARFYELDILAPELADVFAKEKPEWVNHHAAQIDVRYSVEHPMEDARINILGALNLLEQCKRYGVRHIVFSSTGGAIYGEPLYLPIDEQHPVRPISHYGAAKLAVETYLYLYRFNFGLDYTILRYGNVYGPRQDPRGEAGVISIFTDRMLRGETPTIFGTGEQTRDYVFVGDVVRINLLCGDRTAGEIINVGTGIQTSVNQLFALLKELTGFRGEPCYAAPRTGELAANALSAGKAKELVGWEPQVNLREGLLRTVRHIQAEQERR